MNQRRKLYEADCRESRSMLWWEKAVMAVCCIVPALLGPAFNIMFPGDDE